MRELLGNAEPAARCACNFLVFYRASIGRSHELGSLETGWDAEGKKRIPKGKKPQVSFPVGLKRTAGVVPCGAKAERQVSTELAVGTRPPLWALEKCSRCFVRAQSFRTRSRFRASPACPSPPACQGCRNCPSPGGAVSCRGTRG
jgi:hypothetical protein